MKRALLLVLLAAGCVLNPESWTRPDTTMAQRDHDLERCKYEALAAAPRGPAEAQFRVLKACMRLAGYKHTLDGTGAAQGRAPSAFELHDPVAARARNEAEARNPRQAPQAPPQGRVKPVSETFRDIKFGDKPKPSMVEFEVGDSGSIYKRPIDNLSVFGVMAEEILYFFERRGLMGVLVIYPAGTETAVGDACAGLWGEPSKIDGRSVWWDGEDATANLVLNKDGKVQLFISKVP